MRASILVSLFSLVPAMAQMFPIPVPLNLTQASGMIGVALLQTARLNVLNSSLPSPSATAVAIPACKVTLQIFDDQDTKLAELDVDNLAPGKAAHLDYARLATPSSAAPQRVQVRGVVATAYTPATGTAIPPVRVMPFSLYCTLVSTLEVFDSDTGKTQVVLPLTASPGAVIPVLTATP